MAKSPTTEPADDVATLVDKARNIPSGQVPGATAAAADKPAAAKPAFSFGEGTALRQAQHRKSAKQLVTMMKSMWETATTLDSQTSAFRLQCASDPDALAALQAEGLDLEKVTRFFTDLNGTFSRFEA